MSTDTRTGHGDKLSRKQEQAIAALLAEPTIGTAATAAKVSESTLWRWLQQGAFRTRYRAARAQVVESAIGSLQRAATKAVAALERNLECGQPSVEVSAARAILDNAVRAFELLDLAERVEALEAAADGQSEVAA